MEHVKYRACVSVCTSNITSIYDGHSLSLILSSFWFINCISHLPVKYQYPDYLTHNCPKDNIIEQHEFELVLLSVGYHLPFRHNELVHLPYMAVALIPDQDESEICLRSVYFYESETRRAFPIVEVYPNSIANVLTTNSLSLVNTLSCKYTISSHIVVCLIITTTCVH